MVKFGSSARFPPRLGVNERPTPGPQYTIPSSIQNGLPKNGHITKRNATTNKNLKHLFAEELKQKQRPDRDSWLQLNANCSPGPKYSPDHKKIKSKAPCHSIGKGPRFLDPSAQYITREHLTTKLCGAGPGPKYLLGNSDNVVRKKAPNYSFGARQSNQNAHDGFLKTFLGRECSKAGPAGYDTSSYRKMGTLKGGAPRALIGNTKRFRSNGSKGVSSPGPIYFPENKSISARLQKRKQERKLAQASVRKRVPAKMKAKKSAGRSAWLRGNNYKDRQSGHMWERRVMHQHCSPGPGCYNIPGMFDSKSSYYEPLRKRKGKKKKQPQSARRANTARPSARPPKTAGPLTSRRMQQRINALGEKKTKLINNLLEGAPRRAGEGDKKPLSDSQKTSRAVRRATTWGQRKPKTANGLRSARSRQT